MYNYKTLVFSYSLLVSMLSHSSVFTSPLGRSPPFWVSFPDMVAAVTMACIIINSTVNACYWYFCHSLLVSFLVQWNSVSQLLTCISSELIIFNLKSTSPWSCVFVWVRSARGGRGWCRPWACRASPETQRQTGWGRWSGWWFGYTSRERERDIQRQRKRESHLSHFKLSDMVCVIIQLQNTPDKGKWRRTDGKKGKIGSKGWSNNSIISRKFV